MTETSVFLELLFGQCPSGAWLLVWELSGKKSTWFQVGRMDRAAKFAATRPGDTYFGVALSPENFGPSNRCEAGSALGIVGLWADIDIKSEAHKKKALPETMEQALDLADSLGVSPTVSVDSGHGLQVFWLFGEPWIFANDEAREQAERLVERFQAALRRNAEAAGWALDGTHDLARVLRVPGTVNRKIEGQPADVKLIDAGGPRYDRDALASLLAPPAGKLKVTAGCSAVERARRYVSKLPPAISGSGGHRTTFKVAQVLRRGFALSLSDSFPIMREYSARCDPPWNEKELEHKLESAEKKSRLPLGYLLDKSPPANGHPPTNGYAKQASQGGEEAHLTDLGNARRVVERHGKDMRFCFDWKQFLTWDGGCWRTDNTGEAVRRVKDTQGSLYRFAVEQLRALGDADEEDDQAKAKKAKLMRLLNHALKWEDERQIKRCLELLKSEPSIPIKPSQMDGNGWLLNVRNGTIDLRTGRLREHRREDLLTKIAPVDYDVSALCPLWERCVARWMNDNPDLIEYLRRVVGYSLSADVSEQVLFFLHGAGSNGKSTFLSIIRELLGDYACQAVSELLLAKNSESHPTERADLFGRRFVATIETDEGKRMAEALMKQLTGGDNLKARRMRQDFFEMTPTWKLFLAANHRPVIRGTDFAVWRRIRLIPFTATIAEAEKDKQLTDKLRAEFPGILAWAVRGGLEWQRHGLADPEEVRQATAEYQREQDSLANFFADCCVVAEFAKVKSSVLLKAYQEWSGDRIITPQAFRKRMNDKGFHSKEIGGSFFYQGIGLPASEGDWQGR